MFLSYFQSCVMTSFSPPILRFHLRVCWNLDAASQCWRTPLIPALGRQRQADFWVWGQPGLQCEIQGSQGYTDKPSLKKPKPKPNQTKPFRFFCLFVSVFWDMVSLHSPGCPRTHFVDQAGLKLRNLPASTSQVLELKVCTTTAWLNS